MILYKYLTYTSAIRLVSSKKVSFSSYFKFNDPYELCCLAHGEANINNLMKMNGQINVWGRNTAILCLTRQPLNPLMWAHYSDAHRGVVIGIDVSDSRVTNLEENIIPAQFGNVIYIKTQPTNPYMTINLPPTEIEDFIGFNAGYLEKIQRTFLCKSHHWSYEEEVRIVKSKQCNHLTEIPEGNVFTMDLTEGAVKEVYIGLKAEKIDEFATLCMKSFPNAKISQCVLNGLSWDMRAVDY